jgi:hypothetical protein
MPSTDGTYWTTDETLFRTLPGSDEVTGWFGFIPSFHDWEIERLDVAAGKATIVFKAFRMTNEIDARGFFVSDRHAHVSIHLDGITGISLVGDAGAIVQDLGVRRVAAEQAGWTTAAGPQIGDLELTWESSVGLEGSFYARDIRFSVQPA